MEDSFYDDRYSGPRHPRRRKAAPARVLFDPWPQPGKEKRDCPRATYIGDSADDRKDARVPVFKRCNTWRCPSCGPLRQRQHMAHFREALGHGDLPLLFATFTLRPEDSALLDWSERVDALRQVFAERLLRRITEAEGRRPRYVAQVDVDESGEHHHLHALIETGMEPEVVAGHWIDAGGGVNHDIQRINPVGKRTEQVLDDIARVIGYIVKGSRWRGHGRLMSSQDIGYGSARAKAAREAHRQAKYAEEIEHQVFIPAPDKTPGPTKGGSRVRMPFTTSARAAIRCQSPVHLPNGEYALVTEYEASDGRATITAVDVETGESLFSGSSSPKLLREKLRDYDAGRGLSPGERL